jgi:CRP/FNR family transcriptional regulator, cyclic AMP receptor protein
MPFSLGESSSPRWGFPNAEGWAAASRQWLARLGACTVLVARNYPPNNLVRLLPNSIHSTANREKNWKTGIWRGPLSPPEGWSSGLPALEPEFEKCTHVEEVPCKRQNTIDPLYVFACQLEFEKRGDTSAGWEVVSAARHRDEDTRAHARFMLERLHEIRTQTDADENIDHAIPTITSKEAGMRTPYGLEVIESCMGCKASRENFFCRFSPAVLRALDGACYHSVMPPGALLFVEGQSPRGIYILCSGKVKLSTTSKEGKVLILKQAEAGEVLGLSAAISGTCYEMTAETSTPCQVNFVSRPELMGLLQSESEVGVHAAKSLSREFQGAYRDIHDLVLARSSSGKLARLLLSCAPEASQNRAEQPLRSAMTHEEMAQRIGSSRETVTRLLSNLKKKRLIRLEGATLIIRDRSGLEALAM